MRKVILLATVAAGTLTAVVAAQPDHFSIGIGPASPPPDEVEACAVRAAAKDAVVRELLAGRTALPAAADAFTQIDVAAPAVDRGLVQTAVVPPDVGKLTPAEAAAVEVIRWAEVRAEADRPGQGAEVRARLWDEFRATRTKGR